MTEREIIRCVDEGANFYLRFFGDAVHMEYIKNDYYSFILPRLGEEGINFVFNVKLEGLARKEQIEMIEEIKALKMPVWWDLQSSDELYKLIYGKVKEKSIVDPADGDELYMAILTDEQIASAPVLDNLFVKKVTNPAEFEGWANVVNTVLNGGYTDIHPINHYHWSEKGWLNCFACYDGGHIVSVASVMNNNGICSLEFVATDSNYRRRGLAKAVCAAAMSDTFNVGAKIITLRAINPGTRELYTSLGYKIYNFAL